MPGTLAVKLARIAIVVAIFALWELLSRSGIVNPRLLPSAWPYRRSCRWAERRSVTPWWPFVRATRCV